jgi:hypothetical protein
MVFVFSIGNQRFAGGVLSQQSMAVAEVPAAGSLAEVAADGAGIAELRAGHPRGSLGQGRIFLLNGGAFEELLQGDQRSDAETGCGSRPDTLQFLDSLDVYEPPGPADIILHQAQQIGAPGKDFDFTPLLPEKSYCLLFGRWACVFECAH